MSNVFIGASSAKVRQKFCVQAVFWDDMTAEQRALATAKYFNAGGDWASPEEYFNYGPDAFLFIDGEAFNIDAEASACIEYASNELMRALCPDGMQLRYFPSSVKKGKALFIQYKNEYGAVYNVYEYGVKHV